MGMDEAARRGFAQLIAERVPTATLEAVVDSHQAIDDFDLLVKSGSPDPDQRRLEVAASIVERYNARDALHNLAMALRRRMRDDDEFIERVSRYLPSPETDNEDDDDAKQATLALRANSMRSRPLREFLFATEYHVCAIISTVRVPGGMAFKTGTGFLVGPDLVLTAFHNIKEHVANDQAAPGSHKSLRACFDFFEGNRIDYPNHPCRPARSIAFHENWLISSSLDLPRDGLLDADAERASAKTIAERLDYALVRLSEPIGRESRDPAGGARRGWVNLIDWTDDLQQDERIIIPQHPDGRPQCVDFGRFSETFSRSDLSRTRIRYNTETEPGTSGAPCFTYLNAHFQAVGMHNATFKPTGEAKANQAIDIRRIFAKIQPHMPAAPVPVPTRLWNVSTDVMAPRVILHRDILLDWVEAAAVETVTGGRSHRLYAAVGSGPNDGKSFSIDILKAARRGQTEPIVVLGAQREAIPATVPDFMAAVFDQLGMSRDILQTIPPRPASDLPAGSSDGDKLRRWASEEVPRWFAARIGDLRNSSIDRRAEAKELREFLRKANKRVPREIDDVADSPVELKDMRRWKLCWIVLDGLRDTTLSAEVQDLVAGVTGGKLAEESMPQELTRLRWLFLGRSPEFADATEFTREELNPLAVGPEDMLMCLNQLISSLELEAAPNFLRAMVELWFNEPARQAVVLDPERRLGALQSFFIEVAPLLRRKESTP